MIGARSGFTVLELLIAVVIVSLIAANVSMVMKASSAAYEAELLQSELDDQSDLAIERIRLALMSSSLGDLNPDLDEGGHTSIISYLVPLGRDENDVPVFEDPEEIRLEVQDGNIVWLKNPDDPDPQTIVWTRDVPQLLRGEVVNGEDDNGNDIADEEGLVFKREGQNLRIQLSVQRQDSRGVLHSSPMRDELVAPRN